MMDARQCRSSPLWAVLLIAFGGVFLLHNLFGETLAWQLFDRWWPALLILLGLALLARRLGDYKGHTRS